MIYLKYINWNDTTKVWDTSSAHSFKCLDIEEYDIKSLNKGTTVRQIKYSNKLSTRSKWNITIGADVLYNDTEWNWLVTFFKADRWELSTDGLTYTEVVNESEELVKERTANHKKLRKTTLVLIQKEGN